MNIEELIKFHQELLNQQRDHKAIQKETMRLVTMLNKNASLNSILNKILFNKTFFCVKKINFMSEKLDEMIEKGNV